MNASSCSPWNKYLLRTMCESVPFLCVADIFAAKFQGHSNSLAIFVYVIILVNYFRWWTVLWLIPCAAYRWHCVQSKGKGKWCGVFAVTSRATLLYQNESNSCVLWLHTGPKFWEINTELQDRIVARTVAAYSRCCSYKYYARSLIYRE